METTKLETLIEDLKPLYKEEKQRLFEKISSILQEYPFLKDESALELFIRKEEIHSKLLAYIWENNPKILYDFIQSIPQLSLNEQLMEWILKNDYTVKTEQRTTDNKSIDILITDNKKRYCIAVENKINSVVSNHEKGKSQLDSYSKHINKKMSKDTIKLYILLSHRNNKKYTSENDWCYADYFCVFQSLKNNYTAENHVLSQYLIAVSSLLFNYKEIGKNIDKESSITEMSLFYQEIIKYLK